MKGNTLATARAGALTGASVMAMVLTMPATASATDGVSSMAPIAAERSQASPPAQTATGTPQEEAAAEEIVVTGIRQSLQSAQALKRNSDVVVDSISSEDIGALPDRSVTEALQRVPGVSISRFQAGADPDHFAAEGSGVVVRGLTYTRSELNGRDTFSAGNGRGLSFADVPAELLFGVDVFKSPSADMIEGGIAGTVNLRTRLPFDSTGFLLGGTLENNYGDFVKKSAPTVSVLLSNRWKTGIGDFGLLGSFVRSQIRNRADSIQISNWGTRVLTDDGQLLQPLAEDGSSNVGTTVYVPRGAAVRSQEYDRVRYGYSAAAQWRSLDGRTEASLQFLRSDSREAWTENAIEVATDNVLAAGDSQPFPGTTFDFDDDNAFTGGLITGPNGFRADSQEGGDGRTPTNGLQSNNIARGNTARFQTNDISFAVKSQLTDRLNVSFDYQHVWSNVNVTDLTVWGTTYQNADIRMNGKDPAQVTLIPVTNERNNYQNAANPSYLNAYNNFYRSAMDHLEDSEGNSDAARIDFDYSFPEESWLKSVKAGYRFADRQNEARSSAYNWGVLSEIWGGGTLPDGTSVGPGGPVWFDRPIDGNPATRNTGALAPQEAFLYSNFFRGQEANPSAPGGPGRLFFPGQALQDYGTAIQTVSQIAQEWRNFTSNLSSADGWVPLQDRAGVIEGTPYLPGEVNPVSERNNAAYFVARFGNEFDNGWNLTGNVGVRYTHTSRVSSGFFAFPQQSFNCVPPADGQVQSRFCALPQATRDQAAAFQNGALVANDAKLNYDYFLPSANFRLAMGGGLQFRVAVNKTVAPPDFLLTRSFYNVSLGTGDQTILFNGGPVAIFQVGNPFLEPVRSDNFDLTAEWYFSDVGQLTLSAFAKNLRGVQVTSTERQTFTNNGATFDAIVTTPLNSDEIGRIRGLELGYQQTYDFLPGALSGFGLSGNFTYVHSSGVSQSNLDVNDPNVAAGVITSIDVGGLPLQGLSKYQFNLAPFYQKGGLEVRAAYNWRSKYLLTIRDVIVPNAPVIQEPYGQLDASIFYAVTPDIRMGFQAVNLTSAITRTNYVINNDLLERPRNWFIGDSRYTFSIRANFR